MINNRFRHPIAICRCLLSILFFPFFHVALLHFFAVKILCISLNSMLAKSSHMHICTCITHTIAHACIVVHSALYTYERRTVASMSRCKWPLLNCMRCTAVNVMQWLSLLSYRSEIKKNENQVCASFCMHHERQLKHRQPPPPLSTDRRIQYSNELCCENQSTLVNDLCWCMTKSHHHSRTQWHILSPSKITDTRKSMWTYFCFDWVVYKTTDATIPSSPNMPNAHIVVYCSNTNQRSLEPYTLCACVSVFKNHSWISCNNKRSIGICKNYKPSIPLPGASAKPTQPIHASYEFVLPQALTSYLSRPRTSCVLNCLFLFHRIEIGCLCFLYERVRGAVCVCVLVWLCVCVWHQTSRISVLRKCCFLLRGYSQLRKNSYLKSTK